MSGGGSDRREVRVSEAVFARIDEQLRRERGPNGEPSATDFIVMELPTIVESFATGFVDLPEMTPGVPAARMFLGAGVLVSAVVAYGLEMKDGAIELVGIDIDR